MKTKSYMGVDVGSISTNIVVSDEKGDVLAQTYRRVEGNPIRSIQSALKDIQRELPGNFVVEGVCTTGSGRTLTGAILGADIIKNEISAHACATLRLHPNVQTIFEIGGQDSKVTIIR